MKTSIIIPAYNAERYLALTLDSVLAQTDPDWAMVIVDDGSTDGTRSIAEEYAARDSRIQAAFQTNGGVAAARNAGFALTSPQSKFVIFLDNDDLWEPELLRALSAALEETPNAIGAYCVARYIDGAGAPVQPGVMEDWMRKRLRISAGCLVACGPEEPTTFAGFAVRQWLPTPGALLVRRRVLEEVGGYDQAASPCEDYDFALRLTRRGGLALVDSVLLNYRLHSGMVSANKSRLNRTERAVRRKQIACTENTPAQKLLLQQGFRSWERETYFARLKDVKASLLRRDFRAAGRSFLYGQANLLRSLHGRP